MGTKTIGSLFVVAAASLLSAACGGCYEMTEGVNVTPRSECLKLWAGSSATDPLACGMPSLGGTNDCSEPLTFPKRFDADEPLVVAPGQSFEWRFPVQSVAPDIVAVHHDSNRDDYSVVARLGDRRITIAVATHYDD